MRSLAGVFFEKSQDPESMIEKLVDYSTKARKSGIVSLEQVADQVPDPFLRKALNLAVDGTDLQELRSMMELEIAVEEHHSEAEAKIFESAGGYAPPHGIIAAGPGQTHGTNDLAHIQKCGHGLNTPFVTNTYWVWLRHLFLR